MRNLLSNGVSRREDLWNVVISESNADILRNISLVHNIAPRGRHLHVVFVLARSDGQSHFVHTLRDLLNVQVQTQSRVDVVHCHLELFI